MAYPAGYFRIEQNRADGSIATTHRFFWPAGKVLGDFQSLARSNYLRHWRWKDGRLEPIKPQARHPETVIVSADTTGEEICRWSRAEEEAMGDPTRS